MSKNITCKKGKWEQYDLPFNIKAVGNIIKWGREEGALNGWGRKSRLQKGVGEEYPVIGNYIHS